MSFHSPVFSCCDILPQQYTLYCTISPLLKTSHFVRLVRPIHCSPSALYSFHVSSPTISRFSVRFVTQPLPSSASRLLTYVFYVFSLQIATQTLFERLVALKLVYHPLHATKDFDILLNHRTRCSTQTRSSRHPIIRTCLNSLCLLAL